MVTNGQSHRGWGVLHVGLDPPPPPPPLGTPPTHTNWQEKGTADLGAKRRPEKFLSFGERVGKLLSTVVSLPKMLKLEC